MPTRSLPSRDESSAPPVSSLGGADAAGDRVGVSDGLPRRVPLPAIVQTLWSLFGMDSFLRFCLKRFPGEKMLAFRIVGFGDVVSVLDPQLIREVLRAIVSCCAVVRPTRRRLGCSAPTVFYS